MNQYLRKEELDRLVLTAKNLKEGVILKLLAYTGISRFELVNLKINDIDFDNKQILIQKGKSPPNLPRKIYVSDDILQTIKFYIGTRKTGRLIQSNKAKKMSLSQVNRIVQNTAKLADLQKVSPKTLRHSYAANLLEQGATFEDLQKQLGHVEMRTTIRMYKTQKNNSYLVVRNPTNLMQI